MILNEFVSPRAKFVDLAAWDACVQPSLVPVVKDRSLRFGLVLMPRKRDSTALVAVHLRSQDEVRSSCCAQVFTPTPGDPIDFESTVEKTLRDWQGASACDGFCSIRTRWWRGAAAGEGAVAD